MGEVGTGEGKWATTGVDKCDNLVQLFLFFFQIKAGCGGNLNTNPSLFKTNVKIRIAACSYGHRGINSNVSNRVSLNKCSNTKGFLSHLCSQFHCSMELWLLCQESHAMRSLYFAHISV